MQWIHNGMEISISGKKFRVAELEKEYQSYDDAAAAIDRHRASAEKVKRTKLNLKCVTKDLKEVVITGIHAGHKNIVTKPALDRYERRMYADRPGVREALAELNRLEQTASDIKGWLFTFEISEPATYRMEYDQVVAEVVTKHEAAMKASDKFDVTKLAPAKKVRF